VLVGGNGLVLHVDPASGTSRIVPAPTSDTLSGVAPAADGAWVLVGNDGVHLLDPRAAAPEVTQ
jgi:streptogramin lyase